jgi:hypothetical protein
MKSLLDGINQCVPAADGWQDSESSMQIDLLARCAQHVGEHPELMLLHSIPNGDWRGVRTAVKIKAEGQLSGMPDLCLPAPRCHFGALYVELKKKDRKPSPAQVEVMNLLHLAGNKVVLTNSIHVALRSILEYIQLPPPIDTIAAACENYSLTKFILDDGREAYEAFAWINGNKAGKYLTHSQEPMASMLYRALQNFPTDADGWRPEIQCLASESKISGVRGNP